MPDYATFAEQFFADYLDGRKLPYEYESAREPGEPGGNPDFVVHAPTGDVVCEVTEALLVSTAERAETHDRYFVRIRQKL